MLKAYELSASYLLPLELFDSAGYSSVSTYT